MSPHSFSLAVAAPSMQPDADAPWAAPARGERGLAAMFWVSFHGLSVFIHTVLITLSVAGPMILAIVPIPFIAAMCVDVKSVDKPIERVEMAIVELPPPPPPPPPEPEIVEPVVEPKASKKAVKLARDAALKDAMEFGMIGLLSSSNNNELSAVLMTDLSANSNVLGALSGAEIGDSFGVGGLGLSGVGQGGGGRGEGIGLGRIGTIGRGAGDIDPNGVEGGVVAGTGSGYGRGGGGLAGLGTRESSRKVRVALDELAPSARLRLERFLAVCTIKDTITGTVVVVDDAVTSVSLDPSNACAARMLKRTLFDADGTFAVTISPVAPIEPARP
jgi:hypothetical protein